MRLSLKEKAVALRLRKSQRNRENVIGAVKELLSNNKYKQNILGLKRKNQSVMIP